MCGNYGNFNEFDREITQVFNRFAGKAVDPANPKDPTLEEMRQEARMHFSRLRLVPEGTQPRANAARDITRINAELIDAGNGQFTIGNRFFRA